MRCSALVALVLVVGCQRKEAPPEPAVSPPAAASPSAPRPKPGDRVEVHGIAVHFLDGGGVELRGKDRWGNALDTTYENVEFLRNALPVLERSVTPDQAAGLRALVGTR